MTRPAAEPSPVPDLILPLALATAAGVGLGIVLGRTVFAPGRARIAPGGALKGATPPQGAEIAGDSLLALEGAQGGAFEATRKGAVPSLGDARFVGLKSLPPHFIAPKRGARARLRPFRDVDELLASCPTADEMQEIRDDFDISFDARVFEDERRRGGPGVNADGTWNCTQGGGESSVMLGLYNLFRVAKFLTFDVPMPLLNTTSIYEWAREQRLDFRVFAGRGYSGSYVLPGERTIYVNDDTLYPPWRRRGFDPSAGVGGYAFPGIIVHEGWHIVSGLPHNRTVTCTTDCVTIRDEQGNVDSTCGANDSSLEYGGAWAASYWYARWLAEHTGTKLSAVERRAAAAMADFTLRTRICGR